MTGGELDYAALVLRKGKIEFRRCLVDYEPPMNWTLSSEAKWYRERFADRDAPGPQRDQERRGDRRTCRETQALKPTAVANSLLIT